MLNNQQFVYIFSFKRFINLLGIIIFLHASVMITIFKFVLAVQGVLEDATFEIRDVVSKYIGHFTEHDNVSQNKIHFSCILSVFIVHNFYL